MAYCRNHHGEIADKVCSVCGQAYCTQCIIVLNGKNYCPRPYCRQHALTTVKQKIVTEKSTGGFDYEKAKKFIRRNAISLIVFSALNVLISFSGCNKVEMNPQDMRTTMDLISKASAIGSTEGMNMAADLQGYLNQMNTMTENLNNFAKAGDVLSVLSLIAGAGLLTRRKAGRYAATLILAGSVLYTVYFSYLNYVMMKKITAFLSSSELLSSVSGGFDLMTILTGAFAAVTVIYFTYIFIRINIRPVKDCFE